MAWPEAAEAYAAALALMPELPHIWVQLGHAHKVAGDFRSAEAAYRRAIHLQPYAFDPLLQLGHLLKDAERGEEAAEAYLAAFRIDPAAEQIGQELYWLMNHWAETTPPDLDRATEASRSEAGRVEVDAQPIGSATVYFEVTDWIAHVARGARATGIQRVQLEVVSQAIRLEDQAIGICCFAAGRNQWVEIPTPEFQRIVALTTNQKSQRDPSTLGAVNALLFELAQADPIAFRPNPILVNLGTSWWQDNYFLAVRTLQASSGLRYVPFIHDLIPILYPEYCVASTRRAFRSWLPGALMHADGFLTNSQSTRKDLLAVAGQLGCTAPAPPVAVVRLNAAFMRPDPTEPPNIDPLKAWGLAEDSFVLLVSTIEPRKGHLTAFEAWQHLLSTYREDTLPTLVCVGGEGWANGDIHALLDQDTLLAKHVRILHGVSDDELALLYRTCSFAIYPSYYEGWGLPITEAISFGKPVIAANNSSLPEAGGAVSTYFETDSPGALGQEVARLWFAHRIRSHAADLITRYHRPGSWTEIAQQILASAIGLGAVGGPTARWKQALRTRPLQFHDLRQSALTDMKPIAEDAEIFRSGLGWRQRDREGCWLCGSAASLVFTVADSTEIGSVYVRLVAGDVGIGRCTLGIDGGLGWEGSLAAGSARWLRLDCDRAEGETVTLSIAVSDRCEGAPRPSLAVSGFFCLGRDMADAPPMLQALAEAGLEEPGL
jgi:glycosyltransferase involved in cell wall biosynthesis